MIRWRCQCILLKPAAHLDNLQANPVKLCLQRSDLATDFNAIKICITVVVYFAIAADVDNSAFRDTAPDFALLHVDDPCPGDESMAGRAVCQGGMAISGEAASVEDMAAWRGNPDVSVARVHRW